jgi:hypothetical protein
MSRKKARELGILVCECGYPENNHFSFGKRTCAHTKVCTGYKEKATKGIELVPQVSEDTGDPVCTEADECSTELAVLQRYWRANNQTEKSGYYAVRSALAFAEEMREAWRSGEINSCNGRSGELSARNVEVEVALRKLLAAPPSAPAAVPEGIIAAAKAMAATGASAMHIVEFLSAAPAKEPK